MSGFISQEEAKAFAEAKFGSEPLEFQFGGKIINMFRHADAHYRNLYDSNSPMYPSCKNQYNAILPAKCTPHTFLIEIDGINIAMNKIISAIIRDKEKQISKEDLLTLLSAIDSLLNPDHELGKKYKQVIEQTAEIFNIDMTKIRPSLAQVPETAEQQKRPKFEGYS